MPKKTNKPKRWTFIPSPETIRLYAELVKQIGSLNKSANIDAWVRGSIQRVLASLNGGKID
jgi:hypothetical protein